MISPCLELDNRSSKYYILYSIHLLYVLVAYFARENLTSLPKNNLNFWGSCSILSKINTGGEDEFALPTK